MRYAFVLMFAALCGCSEVSRDDIDSGNKLGGDAAARMTKALSEESDDAIAAVIADLDVWSKSYEKYEGDKELTHADSVEVAAIMEFFMQFKPSQKAKMILLFWCVRNDREDVVSSLLPTKKTQHADADNGDGQK